MSTIRTSTPGQDRRAQRRQARIDTLISHALRIVSEEGREALTIARLASEADAAVGALYRYFNGKGELLVMLQARAATTYGAFVATRIGALPPATDASSALDRVIGVFVTWAAFADEHPVLHGLIDESLSTRRPLLDESQRDSIWDHVDPLWSAMATIIDTAVDQGALRPGPARLRVGTMLAVLHGLDHQRDRQSHMSADLNWTMLWRESALTILAGWGAESEGLANRIDAALTS